MHLTDAADEAGFDLFETNTHSFVIRLWLEELADETGRARWRGHITHVPSGKRRYLKGMGDVVAFILPYLEGMGARMTLSDRLRMWLRRWQCGLKRDGRTLVDYF